MTTEILPNEWMNDLLLFGIYLVSSLILLFFGKWVFQITKPGIKVAEELVEKDNLAFSFAYVGYFAGLLLAVGSAIYGESNGLWIDLEDLAIYGGLAIVLLNLSSLIMDKVSLRHFSIWKEITLDRNVGMGIIEGANYLASGLIIFGAVSGESGDLLFGIYTAVAYWALGQVLIIVAMGIYDWLTPYSLHKEIEKDNNAAGVAFAGLIIAVGNIIRHALMGDFATWSDTLVEVAYESGLGLLILPLIRTLVDRILLPGRKLSDEIAAQEKPNIGAGVLEAFGFIGGSILIIWCI